jgi:DNA-directed RNA polymerase subunit beta
MADLTATTNGNGAAARNRIDFSKIKATVPLPNLIEVQKRSYERFLQMFAAPQDREEMGLQAVFRSVFPINDFRETSSLEFVEYSIGNWECKCGALEGVEYLRVPCPSCAHRIIVRDPKAKSLSCPDCGVAVINTVPFCDVCGDPVSLKFKYDVDECQERGMTFTVPLKVKIRLVVWDKDPDTGSRSVRDIKEQEVYFGEIPMLTGNGTFVINGTERVIVSQLHRSPGVFFQADSAKSLFMGKIIPYRGSWVEFEYDAKNLLYVRIDRKRKFLGSVFLRALGFRTNEEIVRAFYGVEGVQLEGKKLLWKMSPRLAQWRVRVKSEVTDSKKNVLVRKGKMITSSIYAALGKARVKAVSVDASQLAGACSVTDIPDPETGEVLVECCGEITPEALELLAAKGIGSIEFFHPENDELSRTLLDTTRKGAIGKPDTEEGAKPKDLREESLLEIYKRMRPGDPPTRESAESLFKGMFEDPRRYDLSRVGRLKYNTKLGTDMPLGMHVLYRPKREESGKFLEATPVQDEDFTAVIRYLLKLKKGFGNADDIDHLGNRRVRAVGELLENQFRIGLVRMERAIKERMSVYQEMTTAMPHDLINAKPVMAAIQEFFGSSQLSQFMDQTNPLSEVTHKRRLSALGPGGLSRDRAGFEVRDVHATHYGRICPIETPEGPNIGLISSLSCYARINEFGFIESPYKKVDGGRVRDYVKVVNPGGTSLAVGEIVEEATHKAENRKAKRKSVDQAICEPHIFYLSAWEEDKAVIAQANARLDEEGRFLKDQVRVRKSGEFKLVSLEEVNYIDVSPKQLVSVAASLIPFLENDDANRALMGSNMQRQAVPLLRAEAPLVGTGMEAVTARDSGAVVVCRRPGLVDSVDSRRIIVRVVGEGEGESDDEEDFGADIYTLTKFKRSNQNTCITQKPLIAAGDRVQKGQILADGPCTDGGDLALGRNILVAFLPWRGYNFEDAILVSERLVKEDLYTSIHIEEFDIEARDTKLGPEEITRDIPNVSEEALRDLDESGIIRIGAHVKPGDIQVGKITPKGETQLTPEEKLLRAIFGEKSGDVRDASLTCPPGIEGTVVDVKIFSRKGVEKDARAQAIEDEQVDRMKKNFKDEERIIREEARKKLVILMEGEKLQSPLKEYRSTREKLSVGTKLTREILDGLTYDDLRRADVKPRKSSVMDEIQGLIARNERKEQILKRLFDEKREMLKRGDELPPGVIKMVKVFVAMKRKLQVGDKMAGRHGNKGVIAKILPEEDMPMLPDGTPVEIVLNPLGVPSRMNVGQILETHLGWAARVLGFHFATPVFDGASEDEIRVRLKDAVAAQKEDGGIVTVGENGKTRLIDGRSGETFDQQVTVGYIYMLKLSHLVDDKIHARSIGPYSLITQQPLGGKAQFGGQRFGEMEVWALEAYGAAHILQELLTAKSDDVFGRTKIYEALVKGEATVEPGLPESFHVLVRELQSLGLDVELRTGSVGSA